MRKTEITGPLLAGSLLAVLPMAGTGAALAKDVTPEQKSHCIVPAGSTGQVLTSNGNVQVSGRDGFSVPTPGMALSPGSRIIVGARSDAQIVFGGCHLSILPLRDISVDPVDGGICLRETLIDGLTAGADRAKVTTLGTRSGTYAQAAVGAAGAAAAGAPGTAAAGAAAGTAAAGAAAGTAAAGAAAAAGTAAAAGAAAAGISAAAIVGGVAAIGAVAAVAVAVDDDDDDPAPVDPVEPVSP